MNNFIISKEDFLYLNYYETINSKYKKLSILFTKKEKKEKLLSIANNNITIIFQNFNFKFNIKNGLIQNTNDKNHFVILWEDENYEY